MADLSDDDDDRILGIAGNVTAASGKVADTEKEKEGEGGEEQEEELVLNLGSISHDSEGDAESERIHPDEDSNDGVMDGSYSKAQSGEGNGSFSDEMLRGITSKHEAKGLGRTVYKRWKKLHKQSKKEKKHKSGKKRKEKTKAAKRGRHSDESDDDDVIIERTSRPKTKRPRRERTSPSFSDADDAHDDRSFADREVTSRAGKTAAAAGKAKKKLTAEETHKLLSGVATSVIAAMREARRRDEADMREGRPPLHRVSIKDQVVAQCRREQLRPFFIEGGILQELSTWLYDFARGERAALELRTAALDLLLEFPIEGEVGTEHIARNGDEILDVFTGMSREHLIHTDIGSAVNALRQDKRETHVNRGKAVRLLERLSRAMTGGVRKTRRGSSGSAVTWKCQNDPTVAPPFHVVRTGTEVFQQALVRPDPLDPLSYLRVPPRRVPQTYVTNLGGNVGFEDN